MTHSRALRAAAVLLAVAVVPVSALPAGAVPVPAATGSEVPLPDAVLADLSRQQERLLGDVVLDGPAAEAGTPVGVAVLGAGGGLEVETLRVEAGAAAQVVDVLEDQPSVEAVEVAHVLRATALPVTALPASGSAAAAAAAPRVAAAGDPLRKQQWALDTLRAESARTLVPAARAVPVVAVVDSGVAGTHPDLDGVLVPGIDLVTRSAGAPVDPNGHGTHVAGTVGAEVGNGEGVQGVLARARVMPVRVLDDRGAGLDSRVAEGIGWAVDHGASVVNLSLGGPGASTVLRSAVEYAERRGVVVVAAMGNDGEKKSPTSFPAAYPSVLAVAATTQAGGHALYSSVGPHADLAAPGDGILSTVPGGYRNYSGTSMATPHVAAVAAAVRAADPTAAPARVRALLTGTARDLGARGADPVYGAGLVDPVTALQWAAASPTRLTVVDGDRSARLTWQAPAAGPGPVTGYEVLVRGTGQKDQVLRPGATTTSASVAGLVNGLGYTVSVRARTAAGFGPASSVVARPRTVASAPRSPSVVHGDRRATVRWAAPASNGGSVVTGYEVLLRGKGQKDQRLTVGAGVQSVTATGLVNGLGYEVDVRARNGAGLGPAARGVARPRTTPSAPRGVGLAAGSTRDTTVGVQVSWAAPASHGGAVISGYRVLARQAGTTRDVVVGVGGAARSAAVTGLARGKGYTVVVQAVNAAGTSPASARSAAATAR